MAYQPDVIFETKKKLDELQAKTTAHVEKYTKQLEKWEAKFAEIQKVNSCKRLVLSIMNPAESFVDSIDQDQTVQNLQFDL